VEKGDIQQYNHHFPPCTVSHELYNKTYPTNSQTVKY